MPWHDDVVFGTLKSNDTVIVLGTPLYPSIRSFSRHRLCKEGTMSEGDCNHWPATKVVCDGLESGREMNITRVEARDAAHSQEKERSACRRIHSRVRILQPARCRVVNLKSTSKSYLEEQASCDRRKRMFRETGSSTPDLQR